MLRSLVGSEMCIRDSPNPSRNSLTFEFYAKAPLDVIIQVYNAQGQLIREFVDQDHVNNRDNFIWHHDLSPGIYFYKTWLGKIETPVGKFVVQ